VLGSPRSVLDPEDGYSPLKQIIDYHSTRRNILEDSSV
jgi:hypothetical protein